MKKIFFILFCVCFSIIAKADLGTTLLYKTKLVMKNGTTFVVYFQVSGEEGYSTLNNPYCNDKGIQQILIAEIHRNNTPIISFYKKIYIEQESNLGFVSNSNLLKLHVDSIKYTIFIQVTIPDYHQKMLHIIEDEILESIKLKKNKKYTYYMFDMAEIHVFSYNQGLTWKAISKLVAPIAEYLSVLHYNSEKYSKKTAQKMETKIKELEKLKIYFFVIPYPC
jgi:hypothetical protein